MPELPNIHVIREALRAELSRTGLKAKELSKRAGMNETAVRDLLDRTADPRIGTLFRLANALGCSPSTLFGGLVQISGCIRAGGEIAPQPERDGEAQFVSRPPDAVGELMAFRIDGDHMLPAYRSGDIVYVARDDTKAMPADCLGEECVVQAASGAMMLKTVAPGQTDNKFTLHSFNATPIMDAQLVWAAPVVFVMRARISRPRERAV